MTDDEKKIEPNTKIEDQKGDELSEEQLGEVSGGFTTIAI